MYPDPVDPDTQSKISRVVAFFLAPLILIAATAIANEAQTLFNYNLDGAQLAVFLSSIVLPVGGAISVWLYNRGKHEIAQVEAANPQFAPLIETVVARSVENALKVAQQPTAPEAGASGPGNFTS